MKRSPAALNRRPPAPRTASLIRKALPVGEAGASGAVGAPERSGTGAYDGAYWALETFKGRLLGALRMDSGSEDDIVGVAEALYVKEDDRFHETQALKTENSALSIENGRLKFQDAHREVELKTLRAQICELGVEKLRLKTALNVAYGKFGTKAEGELPTLQAVEIRAILDHDGRNRFQECVCEEIVT